mgnify:CR=1 FL=1
MTTRQFSVLADCGKSNQLRWIFMRGIRRNGVSAPFLNMHSHRLYIGWDIIYSYKIVLGG